MKEATLQSKTQCQTLNTRFDENFVFQVLFLLMKQIFVCKYWLVKLQYMFSEKLFSRNFYQDTSRFPWK